MLSERDAVTGYLNSTQRYLNEPDIIRYLFNENESTEVVHWTDILTRSGRYVGL